MKKVFLTILMGIIICSSFALGGCKKDDDSSSLEGDDNFSLKQMKDLFFNSVNEVVSRYEVMEEYIDFPYQDDEYVALVRADTQLAHALGTVFVGKEGYYAIGSDGNLLYEDYDGDGCFDSLNTVKTFITSSKNKILNAEFASYRGYLVNLKTGIWTLENEELSRINSEVRTDSIYFYDSYLKYGNGDSSIDITVKWNYRNTDVAFVESAKVRTNYWESPNFCSWNNGIELVRLLWEGGDEGYIEDVRDSYYIIRGDTINSSENNLLHFSRNLTSLTIDRWFDHNITFSTLKDAIQLKDIVVSSDVFYRNVLRDKSPEEVSEYICEELSPVIYLKEDIEVSETDYFLTIYELATADKTGYVKYVKK